MRWLPLLPLALWALAFVACATLRPLAEIRRELPAASFLSVGGQTVYVEQAGAGEPVVLIHGFGASTYSWRKVMPELARSFHVVALDLTGFGYTDRPRDPRRYTREAQGELVLGVMDALGIARAHLVGHSYGGGLSLWIAARHPERVRSLVLVDSSAPTYANDRRSFAASFRPLTALFLLVVVLRPATIRRSLRGSLYDPSLATPELVGAYFDRLRVEGVVDAYYGLTAPVRAGRMDAVDLAAIDVPALVVWGDHDTVVAPAGGRQAAATLPQGRFALIEDCGHLPMEERPAALLALMLPFLRGLPPPAIRDRRAR